MSIDCSFSIISGIAVAELDCGKNGALDKQSHESDCVHCKFGTVIVLNTYSHQKMCCEKLSALTGEVSQEEW